MIVNLEELLRSMPEAEAQEVLMLTQDVCTQVLGWPIDRRSSLTSDIYVWPSPDRRYPYRLWPPGYSTDYPLFYPCLSQDHALVIVQAMARSGWDYQLQWDAWSAPVGDSFPDHTVTFRTLHEGGIPVWSTSNHPRAGQAICRAALGAALLYPQLIRK